MPNGSNTQPVVDFVELTQDGPDDLKSELGELQQQKLPAIIERVARAREYGDLAENAEYHNARDEQQLIEARIEEIENIINKAKIVQHTRSTQKVGMGSAVEIVEHGKKKPFTVTIVGEFEADPTVWKVSSVSPLGKALHGRKKGEEVTVKAPAGATMYTIKSIE
jgi:transcription elongation factor GreA